MKEVPTMDRVRGVSDGATFRLQAKRGSSSAEVSAEKDELRASFSGVTYTGGRLSGFFGDVVLALEGMEALPERGAPLLYQHDRPLGHIAAAEVTKHGIEVSGHVVRKFAAAADVLAGAEAGFPWQMSVGADPIGGVKRYESGEIAKVNGQDFAGPLVVFERWRMVEASIVELGLDKETEAAVAAMRGDGAPHTGSRSPQQDDRDMANEQTTTAAAAPPAVTTLEGLKAAHPELCAQLEASAVSTAQKAEAARIKSLSEAEEAAGSGPKVKALIASAVKDPTKTADGLNRELLKAAREDAVAAAQEAANAHAGDDATEDGDAESGEDTDTADTDEDVVKARKARAKVAAGAGNVETFTDGDETEFVGEVGTVRGSKVETAEMRRLRAQWKAMPPKDRRQYVGFDDFSGQRMLAARGMLDGRAGIIPQEAK